MTEVSINKVFLSYSRDDKVNVEPVEAALVAQGVQVWRDEKKLRLGQRWPTILGDAISSNDVFLLAWSKDAATSEFVDLEWNTAVARRKIIIPWQLDNTPLPAALSSYQAIMPGRRHAEVVDDLLRALSGDGMPEPPGPTRWHLTAAAGVVLVLLIAILIGVAQLFDGGPYVHPVAGMIRDESGEPLSDVEVSIPELGVSSRTNAFGRFELSAEAPAHERVELMARKVGYRTYETFVTPGNDGLGFIMIKGP